ncbi:MAG TPA: ribosome-binding factor A [Candidatus Nanoarchaeia archaeon]|nr:ribosome-binding factor A [Candidatus Nanoarchaeia archaeon]
MPNIDRINETLRKEIASIIAEEVEIPGGLVTITRVECDTNFYSARILFSVLPDSLVGTALEKLRKSSGLIAEKLKHRVKIRKIPHLIWEFDPTEKQAGALDKIFARAEKEKEISDDELEDINYKY